VSLLDVAGLAKRFGGLQAVRDLSFSVGEREVVALIGPNGAGKTTVFGLLSGFLRPDAGDVRLRQRSIVGLKPHQVCALGLARTFQIVRPFPKLSVLSNVLVGALARHPARGEAEGRARAVLDEVGLAAKAADARPSMRSPSKMTRPRRSRSNPLIARNVVVFPAPFEPMSATTSPAGTARETSRTAITSP
jgi:branched-chain amino acid transport system ATP-binding protein